MTCGPRRAKHDIHVFQDADSRRWVVASGRRRLSRHLTQATAVGVGRRAARRRHVDLVTHGRNGQFRSKDSHGIESPRRDGER